jgi:hypothetical protein
MRNRIAFLPLGSTAALLAALLAAPSSSPAKGSVPRLPEGRAARPAPAIGAPAEQIGSAAGMPQSGKSPSGAPVLSGRPATIDATIDAAIDATIDAAIDAGLLPRAVLRSAAVPSIDDQWRRTAEGWERMSDWQNRRKIAPPPVAASIHPGLVAGFQLLASLGWLWGCVRETRPGSNERCPSFVPHSLTNRSTVAARLSTSTIVTKPEPAHSAVFPSSVAGSCEIHSRTRSTAG